MRHIIKVIICIIIAIACSIGFYELAKHYKVAWFVVLLVVLYFMIEDLISLVRWFKRLITKEDKGDD